jgi:hypothetical protein
MSTIVKLSKPIQAHGKEIDQLDLREPTTKDVMEIGNPQLLIPTADGAGVGIEVRAKLIGQYIVRLAGVPLTSVHALPYKDFAKCQGAIMGFFTDGDESETETVSGSES